MTKGNIFVILSLFLTGCCDKLSDSYYWVDYNITNIRVDDDAEYHVTFQSKSGGVYSERDLSAWDVSVLMSNVPYPVYKKKRRIHTDCIGAVSDEQTIPIRENRILVIPNDYKIETFDD